MTLTSSSGTNTGSGSNNTPGLWPNENGGRGTNGGKPSSEQTKPGQSIRQGSTSTRRNKPSVSSNTSGQPGVSEADAKEIRRLEKKVVSWARRDAHEARQIPLRAFAVEHDLACFKCGTKINDWAKTGVHPGGRRWAVCCRCVRRRNT